MNETTYDRLRDLIEDASQNASSAESAARDAWTTADRANEELEGLACEMNDLMVYRKAFRLIMGEHNLAEIEDRLEDWVERLEKAGPEVNVHMARNPMMVLAIGYKMALMDKPLVYYADMLHEQLSLSSKAADPATLTSHGGDSHE